MPADTGATEARQAPMERITVNMNRGAGFGWKVILPGHGIVGCATLDEARWIAHRHAERLRACELIVQDAYHRVVEHARIEV